MKVGAAPKSLFGASLPLGGSATVRVLDGKKSRAAGVNGLLLTVDAQGVKGSAPRVQVDYASVANAVGAGWGSRLRLVQLPACILTTPERPECQVRTELNSVNDAKTSTVTADLSAPQAQAFGVAAPAVLAAEPSRVRQQRRLQGDVALGVGVPGRAAVRRERVLVVLPDCYTRRFRRAAAQPDPGVLVAVHRRPDIRVEQPGQLDRGRLVPGRGLHRAPLQDLLGRHGHRRREHDQDQRPVLVHRQRHAVAQRQDQRTRPRHRRHLAPGQQRRVQGRATHRRRQRRQRR
ncbi:hypothetical protein ACU686_13405 [Yinghuangia aomiensis]